MAVNPRKGEVEIELGLDADGKAIVRKMRISWNQLALIEKALEGRAVQRLIEEKNFGFDAVRAAIWGGLQVYDPELTLEDVGDLLAEEADKLKYFGSKIRESMALAMPGAFKSAKAKDADAPAPLGSAAISKATP